MWGVLPKWGYHPQMDGYPQMDGFPKLGVSPINHNYWTNIQANSANELNKKYHPRVGFDSDDPDGSLGQCEWTAPQC